MFTSKNTTKVAVSLGAENGPCGAFYYPRKGDISGPQQLQSVEAIKNSCEGVWCPTCFRTIYFPKIAEHLKTFNYKNTVMVTCTFAPDECENPGDSPQKNGRIGYPFLIKKAPVGHFVDTLKRRKVKGKRPLEILGYIAFLEFNQNDNPHYHLVIHFADDAFREHDLQQSWKYGRLHVMRFSSRGKYLDIFPYLRKDPLRYPDKAYQVEPPPDWRKNHPRIVRVLSSRNIPLGRPRPNRKRSPKKDRSSEDTGSKSPVEYHKNLKKCGQQTSFHLVLNSGKEAWLTLPIPYAEVKKLAGKHLKNKRYLLDDPESIQELLERPKPPSKKE